MDTKKQTDCKQKKQCSCQTIKHEHETSKESNEEWKNKYLRALADYQNFEKRVQEERSTLIKSANKVFIIKCLPFLDVLEKAEVFITDKNLKLVKDSFSKILKDEGLEEIDVLGKPFDPHYAEVVDMTAGKENGIVLEVLRKGYKLHGVVIRVAQVKVSKKPV